MKLTTLKIADQYGSVDANKIPKGYNHVTGKRLQPLCRKLKIKFATALTGWGGSYKYPKPEFDGVVVSARAVAKLRQAINERVERSKNGPPRKPKPKIAKLIESRSDRWYRRGDIDAAERRLIDFKTAYRHEHTNYDLILRESGDKEFARDTCEPIKEPTTWNDFLVMYDFSCDPVAIALASILQDVRKCHPVWFAEAVIAVNRQKLDLTTLTYERIVGAIVDWRFEK